MTALGGWSPLCRDEVPHNYTCTGTGAADMKHSQTPTSHAYTCCEREGPMLVSHLCTTRWGGHTTSPTLEHPRPVSCSMKAARTIQAGEVPSPQQHLSYTGIFAVMSTIQDLEESKWHHTEIDPQLMLVVCMSTLPFSLERTVGSGETHICKLHPAFQQMIQGSFRSAMSGL